MVVIALCERGSFNLWFSLLKRLVMLSPPFWMEKVGRWEPIPTTRTTMKIAYPTSRVNSWEINMLKAET